MKKGWGGGGGCINIIESTCDELSSLEGLIRVEIY